MLTSERQKNYGLCTPLCLPGNRQLRVKLHHPCAREWLENQGRKRLRGRAASAFSRKSNGVSSLYNENDWLITAMIPKATNVTWLEDVTCVGKATSSSAYWNWTEPWQVRLELVGKDLFLNPITSCTCVHAWQTLCIPVEDSLLCFLTEANPEARLPHRSWGSALQRECP